MSGILPVSLLKSSRDQTVVHQFSTDDPLVWHAMDGWPADWIRDRINALRQAANELEDKANGLGL